MPSKRLLVTALVIALLGHAGSALAEDPPPASKVQEVSGSGILFVIRPWVATDDSWETHWNLNREAYTRLRQAGIRVAPKRYELEKPTDPKSDRA